MIWYRYLSTMIISYGDLIIVILSYRGASVDSQPCLKATWVSFLYDMSRLSCRTLQPLTTLRPHGPEQDAAAGL